MKKLLLVCSMIAFVFTSNAQKEKQKWNEMHAFHSVMSKTFHPAEENKLQPLRDSATVLLAKAKAWKTSTVPAGYNKEVTAPILKQLVAKCKTITVAVKKNKSDEELKKLITEAHDIFHEIMEKCRKEDHADHKE